MGPYRSLSIVLSGAVWFAGLQVSVQPAQGDARPKKDAVAGRNHVLWMDPGDIKSRNLYYGPGGEGGRPRMPVEFLSEEKGGSNPKFDVRDQGGKKWRVKLGEEAQPETVASRILWAVGFSANENYFYPELKIRNLTTLSRGQNFLEPDGTVKKARLQRHPGGAKKCGNWNWQHNPFIGTREFNGLRVMMALISNWDMADNNTGIYEDKTSPGRKIYEVSDLGASFGMSGESYTNSLAKNNLGAYRGSKFISKVTDEYVDFNFPTHPPFAYMVNVPLFFSHTRMRWVGHHIPRADAKWIGSLLAQLSRDQIRDAFRAGGYTPEQIEAYTDAVQARIAQLNNL